MQEWEECELEKREAREEGMQEGIEKGIKEGKEEGICAMILDNLEEGKSEEQIIQKLIKRFGISQEEACNYVEKFKKKIRFNSK